MADLSNLLVDTMSFRMTVLEESNKVPGSKYVARGEFARSDRATENKRLYPRSLWEREIGRMSKQLENGKVYGELDHPMDGRTQLKRSSHIITDLRLEGDVVVGTAHIMDTDAGRNLKAILDAGGSVGVSSRGFGTTKPNFKGEDVVQPDYKLMTFDFVAEPAMSSAYPEISKEDIDVPPTEAAMAENVKLSELREQNPELYESFMKDAEREYEERMAALWAKKIAQAKEETANDLRSEFAERLESTVKDVRDEIEESVRERLMSDPMVGSAKSTLDQVKTLLRPYVVTEDVEAIVSEKEAEITSLREKLAERDLELSNLAEENEKLASLAKQSAYLYRVEQKIGGSEHAELIRSMVGDVSLYESVGDLDERIESIVEEVAKKEAHEKERDAQIAALEESLAKQKLATNKALEAVQQLSILHYANERLQHHPNAGEARDIIESKQPQTKAEVDSLLESVRITPVVAEDREAVISRIRSLTSSGTVEYVQEEVESSAGRNGARNYNGLGMDVQDIRALSGYEDENPN